jgi:arylsulfatase A-like enzyme
MDHITDQLLAPAEPSAELDRGRPEMQYDFCATLGEIEGQIESGTHQGEPVFAHTRSLNLHISKLLKRQVPPDPAYAGFQEAAADEIRRMDRCFGRFIETLKREGLYDQSVIVLTADHGDSLGEQGRWGHAYTIYPEVMRVPLIVHLPAPLRSEITTDLARPAFSTDIAPTLYALLGHRPASFGSLYGEPLFVPRDKSLSDRRRESFLLASSYGSVHGTLRHNGRSLYIADAIEGRDYAYDTRDNGVGTSIQVTETMRAINWALIRRDLAKLAALYSFSPEP